MLAGYLPFDDDPANPEGDNINLLYKYIVSTPLTFPEYVTPHARDLLRRILVPDPRRRADLFEVARHSWLSEYSHVVGFIGSSTKSDKDIAASAMRQGEEPMLGRSASVREPSSATSVAGVQKQPPSSADAAAEADARNRQRDAKRRTVQLEYVAPKDATARGEASPTAAAMPNIPTSAGRSRARVDGQGPVEVPSSSKREQAVPRKDVPSPQAMPPPSRPARDQARAASDSPFNNQPAPSTSRPTTGNTLGSARLPSRGNSYSQPAMPAPTNANAQGHMSQPKSSSGYIISGPMQSEQTPDTSRPASQQNLAQYQQQHYQPQQQPSQQGHRRTSTLGSIGDRIMGRSNSRRASQQQEPGAPSEKKVRKYPPVSMRNAIPNSNDEATPRPSTESRRPSFGFSRKNSDVPSESKRSSRRFSFLPNSLSFSGKKDSGYESGGYQQRDARPESKGMAFGRGTSRSPSRSTTNSTIPLYYDADREAARNQQRSNAPPVQSPRDPRYEKALPPQPGQYPTPPPVQRKQYRDDGYGGNLLESSPPAQQQQSSQPVSRSPQDPVERYYTPAENLEQGYSSPGPYSAGRTQQYSSQQPPQSAGGYSNNSPYGQQAQSQQPPRGQMRPNQRNFANEYDHGHGGSSSATRRVMDFFRRRGKDRSEV